jgi:hypothetical protein
MLVGERLRQMLGGQLLLGTGERGTIGVRLRVGDAQTQKQPRRNLNKSTMNIPSECRIDNINPNHAMILPRNANPKPGGIFGKDTSRSNG